MFLKTSVRKTIYRRFTENRRLTEQPVTGNCKPVEALHLLQTDLNISSSFHYGLEANLTPIFHHLVLLHLITSSSFLYLSLNHYLASFVCFSFHVPLSLSIIDSLSLSRSLSLSSVLSFTHGHTHTYSKGVREETLFLAHLEHK